MTPIKFASLAVLLKVRFVLIIAMEEACALCRLGAELGAATSSVKKKQKCLNRLNCRDERLTLSKLLENRHSGLPCQCFGVLHNHTSYFP